MKEMPIVNATLLSGDTYTFDVPPNAPLYAVADLLAREILQPAEYMVFFQNNEQLSRYSAVLESLDVRMLIRPTPIFYIKSRGGKLWYQEEEREGEREWDPEAIELEDSIVYSPEPVETKNYTVRYYKSFQ